MVPRKEAAEEGAGDLEAMKRPGGHHKENGILLATGSHWGRGAGGAQKRSRICHFGKLARANVCVNRGGVLRGPQGNREAGERLLLQSSIGMVVTKMRVAVRVERREGSNGVG